MMIITVVAAVGVGLVAEVVAVVVSVAGPVIGDTAAAVAFKLCGGAGVRAARFIAVITAIIIYNTTQLHNNATQSPRDTQHGSKLPRDTQQSLFQSTADYSNITSI